MLETPIEVPNVPGVGRGLVDLWRERDESSRLDLRLRVRTLAALRAAGLLALGFRGAPAASIALVDGAIDRDHPCLQQAHLAGPAPIGPASPHATFLASILSGDPPVGLGICRDCTLVSIPELSAEFAAGGLTQSAAAALLASAIRQAAERDVDVILASVEFWPYVESAMAPVAAAVALAAARGLRTVCAAGNRPWLGTAAMLSAPGLVPVAATDANRRISPWSPVAATLGQVGLTAPGVDIPGAVGTGLGYRSGSSVAAAFVAAAFALLCAAYPSSGRDRIWSALLARSGHSLVPPPLDTAAAFERLRKE